MSHATCVKMRYSDAQNPPSKMVGLKSPTSSEGRRDLALAAPLFWLKKEAPHCRKMGGNEQRLLVGAARILFP